MLRETVLFVCGGQFSSWYRLFRPLSYLTPYTSAAFPSGFFYRVTTPDLLLWKHNLLANDRKNVSKFCGRCVEHPYLGFNCWAYSVRRHVCPLRSNRQGHFLKPNSLPNSKNLVNILCCYLPQCCERNTMKVHTSPNFFRPQPPLSPACSQSLLSEAPSVWWWNGVV